MGERSDGNKVEDPGILLGILSAVERDSRATQRSISSELGIALGLTNAYLRRCARKGLIKVREVPLNRYAYYLTPRGFAEKGRLTAEYLAISLNFFRSARRDCAYLLEVCANRGWSRLVLFGAGDLAEITIISASDAGVDILAIVDPFVDSANCAGRKVWPSLAEVVRHVAGPIDAIIVTDTKAPQASFDQAIYLAAAHGISPERVLPPSLLHITARAAGMSGEASRSARHPRSSDRRARS